MIAEARGFRPFKIVDAANTTVKISTRNPFSGTIIVITPGAVNASVKVNIGAGNVMTSNMAEEAIADLGLAVGDAVIVIVKASDVFIGQ